MAEIYPIEDVLKKLESFTPLRRILLATAGTNQATLSVYHGKPVMIEVTEQVYTEFGGLPKWDRSVNLFVEEGSEQVVVCRAKSVICATNLKVKNMIKGETMGIGQIMEYMGIRPAFQLTEVGKDDSIFWRVYTLEGPGITYSIREEFPVELY